jgi:hypothetical protein
MTLIRVPRTYKREEVTGGCRKLHNEQRRFCFPLLPFANVQEDEIFGHIKYEHRILFVKSHGNTVREGSTIGLKINLKSDIFHRI